MFQLLVTQVCNNGCMFCATESPTVLKASFVPGEKILSFVDEGFRNYPETTWDRRVVLSGGEPTLHPELVEIVRALKARYEMEIGLQSNCRNMADAAVAAELKDAGVDWVLSSIYGPNAALHDKVTRRAGGFAQTIRGIQNLIEQGILVEARAVLHRAMAENLADYVRMAAGQLHGIWRLSVVTLDYTGCVPAALDALRVDLATVAECYTQAAGLARELGYPLRIICCPLCFLPVETWDLVIPAEAVPRHFLSWEKDTHANVKKNFAYPAACERCLMLGVCPGIAESYLRYYPATQVTPVEDIPLKLRDTVRLGCHDGRLFVGCSSTGNWFTSDQPRLVEPIAGGSLDGLPFRTRREMVRHEFAAPDGFGGHAKLIRSVEGRRGSAERTDKPDWDFFVFNVTQKCNLSCKYCYSLVSESGANAGPVRDILRRAVDLAGHRLAIELHGGEPLVLFPALAQAIPEVERYAQSKGKTLSFLMVTNGTLINRRIARFLKQHDFAVIVSLDGPAEVHDRYRTTARGTGSYARVMAGIRRLQAEGIALSVNSVVAADSVETILEVYRHHQENGLGRVKFIPVVPSEKFGQQLARRVFNAAMIEIAQRIVDASGAGIKVLQVLNLSYAVMALLGLRGRYMCMNKPCGAVTKMLAVNPDGMVYGCHKLATFPEQALGSLFDPRIKAALPVSAQAVSLLAARNVNAAECGRCEFYGLCGGMCYADDWMVRHAGRPPMAYNFDCMYDVLKYFVELAEEAPERLGLFLFDEQVGDYV